MLRASATDAQGRRFYILGLSDANIDELRKDRPILVDLKDIGGHDTVLIFTGESEQQMAFTLKQRGLITPDTREVTATSARDIEAALSKREPKPPTEL